MRVSFARLALRNRPRGVVGLHEEAHVATAGEIVVGFKRAGLKTNVFTLATVEACRWSSRTPIAPMANMQWDASSMRASAHQERSRRTVTNSAQSSSVMNGMKGWSSNSVWRNTRSWMARQLALVSGDWSFDFGDFDIPVTKIIPKETIQRLDRSAEFEVGKAAIHLACRRQQAFQNGVVVGVELRAVRGARRSRRRTELSLMLAAHLAEAAGIPEFVAEVLPALDAVFLEADILSLRERWR